ncbi:hypothetical protein BXT86_04150 [candidate division WOR-3 bacterium 4484_100]|uniref:FAD/NAD(P)-binding domain-containing protein n=1 Tax=candidate division WOR-3 bacterium 4484_100 TaxID=1936077 RepID=A0A1V4QG88_UNCW3|nr:MAG: hypothetical protein BXT86_04150 [candidate division WOR-3 bacterium 4484_100]
MRRSVSFKQDATVVIVGAGPAGIATAIQLKHCGISPVIFEKGEPGGLLRNANSVENYPGFPHRISGLQLARIFRKQLRRSGVKILCDEVLKVDYKHKRFLVRTRDRLISTRFLVVASGSEPRRLEGVEISGSVDNRIFYEVINLLHQSRKSIAIIGAGDAAFDYALNLAKRNNVVIFNRSMRVRSIPSLFRAISKVKNITYITKATIKRILKNRSGLRLLCQTESKVQEFQVSYLLVAIGRKPALGFLSQGLIENRKRLIARGRLYFVGDVKNGHCRQTGIAVGDGIRAGLSIYQRLCREEV